jgi:hypothetical protein
VERFFSIFSTPRIISNTTTRENAISIFYKFCIGICWWAKLIIHFRLFFRFLQMEPITFDMKDAQGSTKHHLVFVLK